MLNKGSGKMRKNPPIDAIAQKSPHEELIPHGVNADAAEGSGKTRKKPPEGIAQKSPPEGFIHHSINADTAKVSGKHARKNLPEGMHGRVRPRDYLFLTLTLPRLLCWLLLPPTPQPTLPQMQPREA